MNLFCLLLLFVVVRFCYGHEYKRDVAMPFAAAAYSDNPNLCLSNIGKLLNENSDPSLNITVYRQYKSKCDPLYNNTCSGYTAISTVTKEIIIAFRGTSDFDQLLKQGWNSDEMVPFVTGGKVSKYLFTAFNGIWKDSGMKNDFYTLKNKFPDYLYIVVGHSVGGAMASLAAATIISTGVFTEDKITLFTFGQPRTGDLNFANGINALEIKTSRVVHDHDIISQLPPLNTSVYFHHRQELWYNNEMGITDGYTFCSYETGEDPWCSDSVNTTLLNIKDHKYYYGREFSQYGINGCPDLVSLKQMDLKNINVTEKRFKHFNKNF